MDQLIESRMGMDAALGVEWTEIARFNACTVDDFNKIESCLTLQLCCEPGRCAWLRSQPFLRLRMTALYFPALTKSAPITLYHQGLRVALRDGAVTVARQDPTAGSFLAALAEIALEDTDARRHAAGPAKRKRPH
jgi:hypothetical protein